MKIKILLVTLVFGQLALAQQNSGAAGAQKTSVAPSASIRYLRPADFKLPARVRLKLDEKRCRIPQDAGTAEPHNIVSGEFARRGQQDWAAYCSVDGKSKLMVVWGGPSQCSNDPFDIGPISDNDVSESLDDADGTPPHGSFWILSTIPHAELLNSLKEMRADSELLNSATHDALIRHSDAGANTVTCHNGHWRQLSYAD
jgi:hypothetical protein